MATATEDTMVVDRLILAREWVARELDGDIAGHELEWAEQVAGSLGRVESALRQHKASMESADGLITQVDLTRPSLARKVGDLRGQHGEFLERASQLREEVERMAKMFRTRTDEAEPALPEPSEALATADFATVREHTAWFLEDLRKHQEAEAGLVIESVTTDLGAGD